MSIGTGIFLSSLLLAVVILYGLTKDRWRWRTFARRLGYFVVGLVVLGVAAGGAFYVWDHWPRSKVKQTEYAGVRIGMTQDEVRYVNGYPPTVFGALETSGEAKGFQAIIETKNLEKGKTVDDYVDWSYGGYSNRTDVQFDLQKTGVVVVQCYSTDKLRRCPAIEGIADGDSEQEVVRVFGKPDVSKIDGVSKSIYYRTLGVFFTLTQESVYLLGVNDTRYQKR
jgi:hypothetical protein